MDWAWAVGSIALLELFGEGTYWVSVDQTHWGQSDRVGVFIFTIFKHVCLSAVIFTNIFEFHPSFFPSIKHFHLTIISSMFIRQGHISSSFPHSFALILTFWQQLSIPMITYVWSNEPYSKVAFGKKTGSWSDLVKEASKPILHRSHKLRTVCRIILSGHPGWFWVHGCGGNLGAAQQELLIRMGSLIVFRNMI